MFCSALEVAALFAQNNKNNDAGAGLAVFVGLYLVILVLSVILSIIMIVGMWKVFEKAGQPGWAAIVPIYNMYVLILEVAKKEIMWFILYIVGAFVCFPVAFVALFVVNAEVAKKFGKDAAYGIGLTLLPFVFYPMLGFGSARYVGNRRKRYRDDDDENW